MKNLVKVLFSPTETFERLRNKGGWIAAFIALAILAVINIWLQMPLVEKLQNAELEKAGAAVTEQVVMITKLVSYIVAPISVAIAMFITALLLLLVNLVVRGEALYMQLAKVALFASVPTAISSLLAGLMIRITDADSMEDVQFSLGALVPDKQGLLYELANIVNPFRIWLLVLLIIGTAVMARKPRANIALWIIIGWLVFVAGNAAIRNMV